MSTSPSWFDQEKFSRLVKKGKKSAPAQAATAPTPAQPAPLTDPGNDLLDLRPSEPAPAPAPIQPASDKAPSQPLPVAETKPEEKPVPEPSVSQSFPPPGSKALGKKSSMMTSQSVSLPKANEEPPSILPAPKEEPIRAPAPTSSISLTSKAPPLDPDQRSLPGLPRRTAPLPALKAIFQYDIPASESAPAVKPPLLTAPLPDPSEALDKEAPPLEQASLAHRQSVEEFATALEKITLLNEDLAKVKREFAQSQKDVTLLNEDLEKVRQELTQSQKENALLREQLKVAEEVEASSASKEELAKAFEERDHAHSEAGELRKQVEQLQAQLSAHQNLSEEVDYLTRERDNIRRDYMELRENYENLKLEHNQVKGDSALQISQSQQELESVRKQHTEMQDEAEAVRKQYDQARQEVDSIRKQHSQAQQEADNVRKQHAHTQQELETARQQLIEREKELESVRSNSAGSGEAAEELKKEIAKLKEQASVAQRGLTLSQKALQETREALREANEGGAAKVTLENLKKENSTLVQQAMLLQAQHDQVVRDLSAAKARLASKG